jgi:phosphoenolpyruvate-protein phosphotransferase
MKTPISGVLMSLGDVPDQVFATRMLGDGFAINPTDSRIFSPIKGIVTLLHKSKHAITIQNEYGSQFLIHIGIDTVQLKGTGFKALVSEGQEVQEGQLLIEFEPDLIALKGLSLITVIIKLEQDQDLHKESLHHICDKKIVVKDDVIALVEYENKLEASSKEDEKTKSINTLTSQYVLNFPNGMHARPAAKISDFTKKSNHEISLQKKEKTANASSVVAILSLGIEKGDTLIISCKGDHPQKVIDQLTALLDAILELEINSSTQEKAPRAIVQKTSNPNHFYGVSASSGISIGKAVINSETVFNFSPEGEGIEQEKSILLSALKEVEQDLTILEDKLSENKSDTSKAAIFAAHKEILTDGEVLEEVLQKVSESKSAAYSWDSVLEQKALELESLKNELIAARANDIRDIKKRVLAKILGVETEQIQLEENSIIIAKDLTPSDIIQFDLDKVIGFCTTLGGSTSHVAILAKSMGVPAIAGIDAGVLNLTHGESVILHADKAYLEINPTQESIENAEVSQRRLKKELQDALKETMVTAVTADNHRIQVAANIGSLTDAEKAMELGAEGVGLLRTEFIFLERNEAPTESEQLDIYQNITNELQGKPLVIRTLDIGGDKQLPYLPIPAEENPFLGVRGIRLCLKNEDIFREQLRAILRVKSAEPLHIMFPMIGHLSELIEAKEILEQERAKLGAKKPYVGIMIEVPSAALMAEEFAKEVDFFSIGTNDLTQYTLAIDRGHNELAAKVDGLNPAVLRLIAMTCKAAKKYDRWVGVCGGVASELKAVPVLIGLGVTELSLSMPAIPLVKATIRNLNKDKCTSMAEKFLSARDAQEVREIVSQTWPEIN